MARKGMGYGNGKGYKNIQGSDPTIHSQSAQGVKQPQKVSFIPFLNKSEDKGQTLIHEIKYDESVDEDKGETGWEELKGRSEAKIQQIKNKAIELYEKRKQAQAEKELEEHTKAIDLVKHPKMEKLKQEEEKMQALERQIQNVTDDDREDELFEQLQEHKEKLDEMKGEIDNIQLEDFSDSELKELAVRHDSASEDSFFGSGENKYEKEFIRRMQRRKEFADDISKEMKKEKEPKEEGFFEGMF
jgi:hypothetical protein